MTHYSVLTVTPHSDEWIPAYLETANRLVAKHGGTYLARTASHERLEGEGDDAALRIVLEWPSRDAALAFMNDPEYQPHLAARTKGSDSHHFLIEGKDDLA
ncbi:MAG: DUF1330 domain-containing protein [Acidobacteriota bacterium]